MGTNDIVKFEALSPAEFFHKYKEIAGFSNPTRLFIRRLGSSLRIALMPRRPLRSCRVLRFTLIMPISRGVGLVFTLRIMALGYLAMRYPMSLAGCFTVVSIGLSSTGVSSALAPRWSYFMPSQPLIRQYLSGVLL